MRNLFYVGFLLLLSSFYSTAQQARILIAKGAKVEKLADGFAFTEGPAADRYGNVFFTDQPNDRIWKWSIKGELSLFAEKQGRANGLYFDKKGRLLSCSDLDNEIWSIGMDGQHDVLISGYDGKPFNGPNDLWQHPNGGIYFTDPLYVRNYWTRNPEMQLTGQHLYFLAPDGKLSRMDTAYTQPNGIVGTPDGKKLYVADIGARKTFVYTIQPDGSLADRKLFTEMGSDGMTIDSEGNIYLTGRGVTVFNPAGEQIEHIDVDARWTANVCFGGKDRKTLFITASEYLYALRMNVKGVKQPTH
ncbi:MAG: SMP-30/gluconolactonase/LRE family protein [Tannerellaceae bacterium]|jgi:gluconolactonase|nr:SMP-30/gluconolactonase/LRE family protein [Tannerellaceae bacterium]